MFKGNRRVLSVAATGAAMNVQLGFTPNEVYIFNRTTGASIRWLGSMPAAAGIKTVTAGTQTYITANGVTAYAGSNGADSAGFTLGADANVNASGNTLDIVALGSE